MKLIREAIRQDRLAQAYLITAPGAAAAEKAADDMLSLIFCETHSGCGKCPGCKKLASGNHVDVFAVNGDAKMDELRETGDFLAKKPFEGGYKAVVIKKADLLKPQAQNFLLKPIEEPGERTVFILTAAAPEKLLATVRSRCQIYRVPRTTTAEVEEAIGASDARSYAAAALSMGYADEAGRLLADGELWEIRSLAAETAEKLVTTKNPSVHMMTERLMAHKDRLEDGVMALMTLFMDALRKKLGGRGTTCRDAEELTGRMADFYTVKGLFLTVKTLLDIYERLAACRNWNRKLAAQETVFRILEVRALCHR